MNNIAPICVFVYNRPWHTIQTIESLKRNLLAKDSVLYVYSDGPRDKKAQEAVEKVRIYINQITGFKDVKVIKRDKNYGLSHNIITGITDVLKTHSKIIILEDDIITSPYFLTYMNSALDIYESDNNVASIHGYVYPIKGLPDTFFLKGADCWGWGTWSRAWSDFELDGNKLLNKVVSRRLEKEIDFNNSTRFIKILKDQIKGKNDSWAIRWHISSYLKGYLTLYPGKSFVKNIGCDNSGTHSVNTDKFDTSLNLSYNRLLKIPIFENPDAKKLFEQYFNQTKKNVFEKLLLLAKKHISKILNESLFLKIKKVIVLILPVFIIKQLSSLFGNNWSGDYKTWEDAQKNSQGYDSGLILDKVFESVSQVKYRVEKFERDSVILNEVEYSWPLLSALLLAANESDGKIHVLDFGGSLGSTYFQNRKILDMQSDVRWSIVEQNHFVAIGKEYIQDERLFFYNSIEECLNHETPNIIVLSSVLQYLSEPYDFINKLLEQVHANYIIIDRTPFTKKGTDDRITVQRVNSRIYKASYPCWLFNFERFQAIFKKNNLTLIENFDAIDGKRVNVEFKGFIYKRNLM